MEVGFYPREGRYAIFESGILCVTANVQRLRGRWIGKSDKARRKAEAGTAAVGTSKRDLVFVNLGNEVFASAVCKRCEA